MKHQTQIKRKAQSKATNSLKLNDDVFNLWFYGVCSGCMIAFWEFQKQEELTVFFNCWSIHKKYWRVRVIFRSGSTEQTEGRSGDGVIHWAALGSSRRSSSWLRDHLPQLWSNNQGKSNNNYSFTCIGRTFSIPFPFCSAGAEGIQAEGRVFCPDSWLTLSICCTDREGVLRWQFTRLDQYYCR